MDESEKLTALKKAYADIILNTAKEAAARIMVSERKAMRFQQELAATKEESLRMLLRLKQMLDSKVKESELSSLTQQKKIEELEAQLQEAEEIVNDVREELREAQAQLENLTKHQMHHLPVEQNIRGEIASQGNFLQENRIDPNDGSIYSAPDSQFNSVTISDTRNPTINATNDGCKLCVSHDHANNCYINDPNFASIVIRRKEPELYRKGCTQRIRACERNLFDGNMSVSEKLDNVVDEAATRVHDEGKTMPVTADAEANMMSAKLKPDELKVVNAGVDLVEVPFNRKEKRFMRRKVLQSRDVVTETNKASSLSSAKGSPCVLDNNYPAIVNSSMLNENEVEKDILSPSFAEVPLDPTATIERSGSHDDTEKEEVFLKDDKDLLEKSDLTRQESLSPESLEVPASRADVDAANGSPCTQRLCACERNLLDGNVSVSEKLDNVEDETVVRVHDEGKTMPVTADAKADMMSEKLKPDELKVVNTGVDLAEVSFHKKKRRFVRRKALQSRHVVTETNKASSLSSAEGSPCVLDNNDPSRVNASMLNENEAQKDKESTATIERSGSHDDTKKEEVFLKACNMLKKIKDDKDLLEKSDLTRQESLSPESLEVPASRTDVDAANSSPHKVEPKVSDFNEKASGQSVNDKFLKYTFRRKRKKESQSVASTDVDCSPDNSSAKKQCVEKQNGHVEPQKTCTLTESSRDSRRLAQVARQLISLSEKKWWQ